MRNLLTLASLAALAGCANLPDWMRGDQGPDRTVAPAPEASQPPDQTFPAATPPPANARTADQFDTSSEADKAAAARPGSGGRDLGTTVASLGAPGEPGFWLKTPLVSAAGRGRVVYPATGKSVNVDLIPLDAAPGAGSRLSLAALRVLGAPLTGLPEVRVVSLE